MAEKSAAPVSPRQQYEAHAAAWLAPYAVREADASARPHLEPPHSYRTCFQRDRERILHCSAFRRLDFKTQVFVPHEQDHFRTRLTHTLEVAQVARSLARALRLNEDLAEAVALAHDLGHPPFGHAGEAVLAELMADHGGFEHNRQSLRVVDYLEHPYPDFRGLNLTNVVRECLAKHESRYDAPACPEFDPSLRAPLEGQLVDLADEIAYTAADLEDALASRWIDEEALGELDLWQQVREQARQEYPQARPIHQRIRAVKGVLAVSADDVAATTASNLAAAGIKSLEDVRRAGRRLVTMSPPAASAAKQLQDFLFRRVYTHEQNRRQQDLSTAHIRRLFAAYVADPALLDKRYQARIAADDLHRVVCDYIAGMTDRFCTRTCEELG